MSKDIEAFQREAAGNVKGELIQQLQPIGGVNAVGAMLDLDAKNIKDLAFQLKAEQAPFIGVFGSQAGGKVTLSIAISDDVVASHDLHAGNMVRELASHIGGGGGGQAFFATAGGKNLAGLWRPLTPPSAWSPPRQRAERVSRQKKRRPQRGRPTNHRSAVRHAAMATDELLWLRPKTGPW